jgi:coenzyme F420 hydrogenase subunit beta
VHETDYATSWGTVLNRHLQARCKICPDGIGEFADVVCADAWYGRTVIPTLPNRRAQPGDLAHRPGEQLLAEATAAGYLSVAPLDVDEIRKMQPYQENRKQMVLARVLALRLMGRPAPAYHRLRLQRTA